MGRRKAAWAHARGVEGRQGRQATDSNPRGLDARALTKKTGAADSCAWNGYCKDEIAPRPCATGG